MIDLTTRCECEPFTDEQYHETDWFDCPKAGHEEGCYGETCLDCGKLTYLDCEDYYA